MSTFKLSSLAWRVCRVDDNHQFVLAALFLGYGMSAIERLTSSDMHVDERTDIIKTARKLGLSDADALILDRNLRP